jgi:ABC-type transporter Mla subunit MlaD
METRSIEKIVWWTALAVLVLAAVVMLGAWN